MSWPSTDFECAIEDELQALRVLAATTRAYLNALDDADGGECLHERRALREALSYVPEPST